jgi:hypothetical protein
MEQSERESGNVWDHTADTLAGRIGTEPICFRGAIDMKGEVDAILKAEDNDKLAAQRVFNENRNCQLWYPHTPGFTPKEHLEKLIMETTENSRRDFEMRLEKDRKEFDLKLFEISQKIQEDSRKIANRSFWFNFFFTLVLVFLTSVQIWLALGDNRFLVQELVKLLIQKLK